MSNYRRAMLLRSGGEEPENRSRDSRGRFTRNEYRDEYRNEYRGGYDAFEPEDRYWDERPHPAHYRDDYRNAYDEYPSMSGRGFRERGEQNEYPEMIGYSGGSSGGVLSMQESPRYREKKLTREDAEKWVRQMQNADGSTGGRWTMEETNRIMQQHGIQCRPEQFYAAMNMVYSDYCKVARDYGIDDPEYWAEMARAFICDKDAGGDKVAAYYNGVVKR